MVYQEDVLKVAHYFAGLSLAEADILTDPNGIYLPNTLPIVRSAHACIQVMLDNLLGKYHPTTQRLATFRQELIDREMELEEYSPLE